MYVLQPFFYIGFKSMPILTILKISDVCYHFACINRGHCVIENGNPKCSCTPGYSGQHCEVKGKIHLKW